MPIISRNEISLWNTTSPINDKHNDFYRKIRTLRMHYLVSTKYCYYNRLPRHYFAICFSAYYCQNTKNNENDAEACSRFPVSRMIWAIWQWYFTVLSTVIANVMHTVPNAISRRSRRWHQPTYFHYRTEYHIVNARRHVTIIRQQCRAFTTRTAFSTKYIFNGIISSTECLYGKYR